MEVIPSSVQQLWNVWGIRGVLMLSLLCQIILTLFGFRRNKTKSIWMRIILWSAYTAADWGAKFSLNTMTTVGEDCEDKIPNKTIRLQAFWAPFLLLHLGGPDTITAYSLEDNELWLRSCLGMFVYVGVAAYISLRNLNNDLLTYLSIPVFSIGIVKYVERIWSLRSKSKEHLKDHILLGKHPFEGSVYFLPTNYYFSLAYAMYVELLCEFLNIPLEKNSELKEVIYMEKKTEDVFKLVQTELRLVYQVLYTKATISTSLMGILIRCISFISFVATLAIFFTDIVPKSSYQTIDVAITYFLLVGAIFVEVWSFIILFLSDWRKIWSLHLNFQRECYGYTKFDKFKGHVALFMIRCPFIEMDPTNYNWSESMGQYNLISSCIKKATTHRRGVGRLLTINEELEKQLNVSCVEVTSKLQQWILGHVISSSRQDKREEIYVTILDGWNLWVIDPTDLGSSILVWHIATDICYHNDSRQEKDSMEICRRISNYMLYLYVMHPSMMGGGIIQKVYCKLHDEVLCFYESECQDKKEIYKKLVQCQDDKVYENLFDGCMLARKLEELPSKEEEGSGDNNRRWEMISRFWGEMLVYAARQGEWEEHVHQLRRGGELLTYVKILMHHYDGVCS